ncbi:hypothetical protein F8E02_07725 [Methanoculleus sp. Wushi-C6]|uniref:Uncharacterized protein n=2 Tax=Methanoculleus caldifontis TaxID=2651577 RepID=A0ABU3X1G7_9EURY|nr:hypothetical protein [Methanoculleus sp. Wushi-C6]
MQRTGICIVMACVAGMLLLAATPAGGYPGGALDRGLPVGQAEESIARTGVTTPPAAVPAGSADSNGTAVVFFSAGEVEDLRDATRNTITPFAIEYFENTSVIVCPNNLSDALALYTRIRLKDGYRIEGHWVYDTMGAYTVPFVVEHNMTVSSPAITDAPAFPDDIRLPEGADTNISRYLEGDDSPESYLQASVFLRELYAINAWWHAWLGWPQQTVLESPERPKVVINSTHAVVTIYTEELYCGYRTVTRYTDTYSRGSYEVADDRDRISEEENASMPICY